MVIQASFVMKIPQVTPSLAVTKLMASTSAVWQAFFLGDSVRDDHLAPPLPLTVAIPRLSRSPTSSSHTALHFPWVFVTFSLVTLIATMSFFTTSAPVPNPLTNFSSSLYAFDSPVHARAQVCHEDDIAQGKLVPAKRCLVDIMLRRSLRAILYGIIIRECFPVMALFFARWATPDWMANCAGAVTTLVTLAPTLLRRCFSYTICLVYFQWPVSSTRPKTSPICPATLPVAASTPVDGQDPRIPEETSGQALQETITVPETTPCDDTTLTYPEVSAISDATELTQTGTAIQDIQSNDFLDEYVEPHSETREDLERTMSSVHPLSDETTLTAISEPETEETLFVSGKPGATSDETGTISTITTSVIETSSIDNEQQHHSLVESQTRGSCVHSHSSPGAVASLIETTLDHRVAEVPGNAQATSTCPTPSNHEDSLALPPSSSEPILSDPHTPARISRPHGVNDLTELPFNGEDLLLIDEPAVQLSCPDTKALVNSPSSLVKPELSHFHVVENLLSTKMPLDGLTLEPINEEGDPSDFLSEPSTPLPIRRTTEICLVTTFTPQSPTVNSGSYTPPSDSPVRYSVRFDLPTTSPITSIGDDPFYLVNETMTPPFSLADEVAPYDWEIHSTPEDEVNAFPMNLSALNNDDLLKQSTDFTAAPRPSSPLMSLRELDPAYREDNESMSFFWTTATPEQIARLGTDDDNFSEVYVNPLEGYGREPILERAGSPDDYIALEPSVSWLLDEIFPETSWRDEDDLLNDTDLPDQPDVEEDWVLTEEMRARIVELKKQFDERRAASQDEPHLALDPISSSFSSHSFNSSVILSTSLSPASSTSFSPDPSTNPSPATSTNPSPDTPTNPSPPASSIIAPTIQSGTVSLSELLSPLQTSADTACAVARQLSPPLKKSSPTMIPRAKTRPRSSLMNLTSAPNAGRGLGSWR